MLNKIVLDIETQKSFDEVGGRNRNHLLRVSVAVAYSYPTKKFFVYEEGSIHKLGELLQEADLVIGYNLIDFDYEVLKPYFHFDLNSVPTLDMLSEVEKVLGHRVALDSIAKATLNAGKTGSGLDAIKYWKAGDMEKLKEYCVEDVKITRDIYDYAMREKRLFYTDFFDNKEFAVNFPEPQARTNKHKQSSLF